MRATRLILIILCVLIAGGVSAASSTNAGGIFSYDVNPSHPDEDPIAMSNLHPQPYIAISSVLPPPKDCMQDKCWPAVLFFANNPDTKQSSKITVQCYAFDGAGNKISASSNWIGLEPDQAGSSVIIMENSDYTKYRKVECRVASIEPL